MQAKVQAQVQTQLQLKQGSSPTAKAAEEKKASLVKKSIRHVEVRGAQNIPQLPIRIVSITHNGSVRACARCST